MTKMISTMFIAMTLLFGACSSNKKDMNGNDPLTSTDGEITDQGLSLELNGSSDSMSAGGLSTVYFSFNSSNLSGSARAILDANSEFLKSNTAVQIQVEGHADERGGIQYNLALGERRANSVRDYLVAMGVDSSRVTTISYGKERPIDLSSDESAWARNRRANFVITAK